MIEVRIPKDIRVYKEKFLFGLTFRQTICTAMAVIINIPLYIWSSEIIGKDAAGWLVMITAGPLALIGYIKYNGMNFEKFAWCILKFLFTPQKRKYVTENFFSYIQEECRKEVLLNAMEAKESKGQPETKKTKGKIRTKKHSIY